MGGAGPGAGHGEWTVPRWGDSDRDSGGGARGGRGQAPARVGVRCDPTVHPAQPLAVPARPPPSSPALWGSACAPSQQGEDSSSPSSPGFWVVLGDFGFYFSPICLVGAKGINKRSEQSWPGPPSPAGDRPLVPPATRSWPRLGGVQRASPSPLGRDSTFGPQ